MSSSAPQKREELSGVTPNRMRSSSGHWSSPHRPGRSTTDANGSPLVSRPSLLLCFDPMSPTLSHLLHPLSNPLTSSGRSPLHRPLLNHLICLRLLHPPLRLSLSTTLNLSLSTNRLRPNLLTTSNQSSSTIRSRPSLLTPLSLL
jgi:hypothetical protein